ncbi:MAG TPA: SDR family oxidoreductase [Anaerolineales bacterium]|nr:SDR family oxidoreductase [Anaerolineales bacterium]
MISLNDKIVVITGSTRGFGYVAAQELLKAGATVIVSGRSQDTLARAVKSLSEFGNVTGWTCDVREEEQVYALARRTVETFGCIDIWINNAGYSAGGGITLDIHPEKIIDMFLANDMGTFYGAQAAIYFMSKQKSGTLVNLYGAGSNGKASSPMGMYATTKAWITSFTRTLAKEMQGSGIHVVGFSPSMILTDMLTNQSMIGERGKEKMKNYGFVLRFLAKPPEVAAKTLVNTLKNNRKEFVEVHVMKPWTPMLGLLRVTWENITKTGKTPKYELHHEESYKPKI